MADTHRKKGGVTSLRVRRVPCHRQRVCIITLNKQGAALALKKKKHFFFLAPCSLRTRSRTRTPSFHFLSCSFSQLSAADFISHIPKRSLGKRSSTRLQAISTILIFGAYPFFSSRYFSFTIIFSLILTMLFSIPTSAFLFPFPFFFILPSIVLLEIHFHISSRDKPNSFITNNGRVQRELQKILKIRKRNRLSEMTFTGLQMILRVYQLRSGELS